MRQEQINQIRAHLGAIELLPELRMVKHQEQIDRSLQAALGAVNDAKAWAESLSRQETGKRVQRKQRFQTTIQKREM